VTVANETHILFRRNYGYLSYTYQLHDVEVTNQTRYDVASITKIMSTTFGIMNLMSSGSIKL
jgi:beta-N-acetylhexosaminidase